MADTSTSYAEERPTKGKPALPGEDCQTNSLESWKPQEKWVWEQVCAGKIANFNLPKRYGGILDQKELEGWSEKRILRPAFLETILLHEPYRGALTRNGVRIVGAWFKKPLDLSNATLTHQLWLHASRFESDEDLNHLQALRLLSVDGSKFTGRLDMNGMEVERSLLMRKVPEFAQPLVLTFAKIGKNLDLSGSTLASIDLMGTHVGGEFALGPPAPRWLDGAKLTLRNTEVGALQDSPSTWRGIVELELDGFTYARLGGFAVDDASGVGARKISWFKKWLEKQTSYSPQPYEQLATVLRKAGYKGKAKAILYEGKKREHWKTTNMLSLSWWWLAPQWLFIGYGYRNFQVLIWCLILCGLGMLNLHRSGLDTKNSLKYWGLAYSVDMLLPIIELHQPHYNIILTGWVRVYFYIHKILGYVLGFFLIAGLSGLTK